MSDGHPHKHSLERLDQRLRCNQRTKNKLTRQLTSNRLTTLNDNFGYGVLDCGNCTQTAYITRQTVSHTDLLKAWRRSKLS